MEYLILIIGFVLLIKGADFFISGASGIAAWLRIPSIIVGLTVVAMGTSAPELSVSITGALQGQSGISVGNIIGSNIFNLLCVGGVAALIMPMQVNKLLIKRDIPISLVAAILFFLLGFNGVISRIDGILFLTLFVVFLFFMFCEAKKSRQATKPQSMEGMPSIFKSIMLIIVGLIGVIAGGEFVVQSATNIATYFGLSQSLVGLTVVALGTSLPELVTTLVAAKKGENDIALGNIIGSNIFNIGLVLGLASAIRPLGIEGFVLIDGIFLAAATVLLLFFLCKKKQLNRWQGAILIFLYIVYLVYIILRG